MKTYRVEAILGMRNIQRLEYLVQWAGFPKEQSTWEPVEHLRAAFHLIAEFE